MSHISEVETEMDSLSALKTACAELGWTFVEGQTTYKWFGKWVGDSPFPKNLSKAEQEAWIKALGTCEHAIKVPGAVYEVGIVERNGKYVLRWDWWHAGKLLGPMGGKRGERLLDAYNIARAEEEARRRGRRTERIKLQNGKTLLRIHLPG